MWQALWAMPMDSCSPPPGASSDLSKIIEEFHRTASDAVRDGAVAAFVYIREYAEERRGQHVATTRAWEECIALCDEGARLFRGGAR